MTANTSRPLKVATPLGFVTNENWQGNEPVEIVHMTIAEAETDLSGIDVWLSQTFTKEMAKTADSLKFIQSQGTGAERVDLSAVPQGCPVAVVFEHEIAIAEWIIMAMIMLNREALRADREARQGIWDMNVTRGVMLSPELGDQTLGIVGLGRIGKKAAAFARGFGTRLIASTRTVSSKEEKAKLGFDYVTDMTGLNQVLNEADFLLLSLPLTQETTGLIGAEQLALMKPEANIINISRAEVIDEKALFGALTDKRINGAALDAWYNEPASREESPMPANLPFWELGNVLMSPHRSAMSKGTVFRRFAAYARNVDHFARGEPLENVVYTG